MRQSVQDFAKMLLDHARTSQELEIMLNYNSVPGSDVWAPGDHQSLDRLKLAINYKQKQFVAHPSVQQLLASIWYEGEYVRAHDCDAYRKGKSLHHPLNDKSPNECTHNRLN